MKKISLAAFFVTATLVSVASHASLFSNVFNAAIKQSPSSTAAPAAGQGFENCPQFFPGVTPVFQTAAPDRQRALCFDSFAVLYSGQSKTPLYVVEKLTSSQLMDAKGEERTNRFYPEARLPAADRAQLADYSRSGFDRGHMAPAGDQPNAQSMAQSFSLANMVPQAPEHNQKVWSKVEHDTRQYVKRAQGPVYVVTGPSFKTGTTAIGPGQVWVPTHLYKLVYDPSANRAWAYWQENSNKTRMSRPISYAELVQLTGINFFPGIEGTLR